MNHIPNNGLTFEIAVSAVILFYLITGHLMALKFVDYQNRTSRPMRLFCLDRFLRIYPPYFAVLTITALLLARLGPSQPLAVKLDSWNMIGNLLLLPVNYFMFTDRLGLLIPQTYSLALEEQFYLILPLLLTFRRFIPAVVIISFIVLCGVAVASLVQHSLSKMNGDYWIYRMLPGTFGIFVLGMLIRRDNKPANVWAKGILFVYAFLFLISYCGGTIQQYRILAVTTGVLAGYPIVSYFARLPRNRIDEMLGHGAYGIFLIHFTVIWAVQRFAYPEGITNQLVYKLLVMIFSIVGGFLIYLLVERPALRFRRAFINRFISRYPLVRAPQSSARAGSDGEGGFSNQSIT